MYNINIDSIGAKDGGDLLFPSVGEYSSDLYGNIKNSMKEHGVDLVEFEQTLISDHISFEQVGKANISIIQQGLNKLIHKPIDTPDILDYKEIEKVVKAVTDFIKNNDRMVF